MTTGFGFLGHDDVSPFPKHHLSLGKRLHLTNCQRPRPFDLGQKRCCIAERKHNCRRMMAQS
jgi:hypothetical protein